MLNPGNAVGAPNGAQATVVSGGRPGAGFGYGCGRRRHRQFDHPLWWAELLAPSASVDFLRADRSVISSTTFSFWSIWASAPRVYTKTIVYSSAPDALSLCAPPWPCCSQPILSTRLKPPATPLIQTATACRMSWEVTYGLDRNSAAGDDGANGDPDNDGLTNANACQWHQPEEPRHRRRWSARWLGGPLRP